MRVDYAVITVLGHKHNGNRLNWSYCVLPGGKIRLSQDNFRDLFKMNQHNYVSICLHNIIKLQ